MEERRVTKNRWFWAWQDDKQEAWLEAMSREGLHLQTIKAFGRYVFESGEPRTDTYRLDFDKIFKLGAERLAVTSQLDTYYTPKDRSLLETGEILRIREENGGVDATYKGPLMKSELRYKPKLEIPFEKEWVTLIENDYDVLCQIRKKRVIYSHDGLIINLDDVERLGTFIEVSSQSVEDEDEIKELFNTMGIPEENIITESYFDLMLKKE